MSKLLDHSQAGAVKTIVLEALEDAGYTVVEENIPGLVDALIELADGDDQLLDEASNLLADGGVDEDERVELEDDF
jgi:RNase adaptor protein for sRNA GlmZ degradation